MATRKNATPVVDLSPMSKGLTDVKNQLVKEISAASKAAVTLGALVSKAGKLAKDEAALSALTGHIGQECQGAVSAESLKVYLSQIRGVIRAMWQGYKPAPDAALGAMYKDAPKGKGRQSDGAGKRGTDKAKAGETPDGDTVELTPEQKTELAIRWLFAMHTPELAQAIEYARHNTGLFMTWAAASEKAKAAQEAEIEALAKPKVRKLRKAA